MLDQPNQTNNKNPKIKHRQANGVNLATNDIHPLLKKIYALRQISSIAELDYNLDKLLPYEKLLNVAQGANLIATAIEQQQKILVIGDFDTDGATSTALSILVLRAFGAKNVGYLVPNRFLFGYGLSAELVNSVAEKKPDMIITVDNGITSIDGVNAAHALGIQVIITDHHLPTASLPNADVIINPNQPSDEFASKNLAGVGVVFYLFLALRKILRTNNYFAANNLAEPNMAQYLDLVALGTVADVVPLDRNNRILVQQGLNRIRLGKCSPGIKALLEITNGNLGRVTTNDLAYNVAPRLNAAGRLDDMSHGIECLLAPDIAQARKLAAELDTLNKERKAIEHGMHREAISALELLQKRSILPNGICLLDRNWHQGVVGIIASKVKDAYHRPAIIFTQIDDHTVKGSARSIPGVHLRDLLDKIAVQHPALACKFGGHAMAAGITLPIAQYDEFCNIFNHEITKIINEKEEQNFLYIDGELDSEYFTVDTAEILSSAEPWGHDFAEPVFGGEFNILQTRHIGSRHVKLLVNIPNTSLTVDAIAFNYAKHNLELSNLDKAYLVYSLDVNEYRGRKNLQLIIEHIQNL